MTDDDKKFMYRIEMTARDGKKYCSSFTSSYERAKEFIYDVLERTHKNEMCGSENDKDVVECNLYVKEVLPFKFLESWCL